MEIVTPKIQIIEESDTYGRFVIEPQERGYGTTIGNALRRVLLASIPGAAITSIKIDGVLHEFSTIPGVKEDTTELILNLREVFVKAEAQPPGSDGETPDLLLRIDKKGPGAVTGADIQTPPEVEVVNPEAYICTLADARSALTMEMTVERGKGYVLPDKQENVKQTIGVIPVGSVFTPVRHVNYVVEQTRVGHETDFERLILEVQTNGSVTPSEAVSQAARILDRQLRLFFDFNKKGGADSFYDEDDQPVRLGPPDARIEELDFSVRTYNCLKKANVMTIGELVEKSEGDLMQIRNFGKKSLNEVKEKLQSLGQSLKKGAPGEAVDFSYDDEDEDEADIEEEAE
ncbi:MAG: DNA-directed RNA polymerase subunit alpha [Armatimonadetes bacterium]|nr:DNA-directed RNA polymerase subunit alpha [Armatimonadota bacterium]